MAVTRRVLLQQGLAALAATGLAAQHPTLQGNRAHIRTALDLEPFVDPLPLPKRLVPIGRQTAPQRGVHTPLPLYRVTLRAIHERLHRDLPPALQYSYGSRSVAPVFEAESGQGILVQWQNRLPARHFLPVDYTLHGAERGTPDSRTVVHLHGGRVPPVSDGYPEHWYPTGRDFLAHYPNEQAAAALWYHDHAMGINRLNIYAGLFGPYLLRDAAERELRLPTGAYELPLMLYDRLLSREGGLAYPVSDLPGRPWTDTFQGDAMVVNGRITPFHIAEPRTYRLRLFNCANSRFFQLALSTGEPLHTIGGDQGMLPAPALLPSLVLAPAERADLLLDLSHHAGEEVVLRSGSFDLLQFRVGKGTAVPFTPPRPPVIKRIKETDAVRTRTMTLNEFDDPTGRAMLMLLNRKRWHEPVTEIVQRNTTELWEFVNLTDDTHPIHLHLVRFQILDRRTFDSEAYLLNRDQPGLKPRYTAVAEPPPAHEQGWKDVVQCPPRTVTRILIPFEGYTGRYLWHCHLLEHEANDMMRPFDVVD